MRISVMLLSCSKHRWELNGAHDSITNAWEFKSPMVGTLAIVPEPECTLLVDRILSQLSEVLTRNAVHGVRFEDMIDSIWVHHVSICDVVMPRRSPHVVELLAIRNRTSLSTLDCGENVNRKCELIVLY